MDDLKGLLKNLEPGPVEETTHLGSVLAEVWDHLDSEDGGMAGLATVEAEGGQRFQGCESDELLVKAARSRVAEALRRREQAGRTSPVPA
jgi:hypothetical protein